MDEYTDMNKAVQTAITDASNLFSEYEIVAKVQRTMREVPTERGHRLLEGLGRLRARITEQFLGDMIEDGERANVSAPYASEEITMNGGVTLPSQILFGELSQRVLSYHNDLQQKLGGDTMRIHYQEIYGINELELSVLPVVLQQQMENAEIAYEFLMDVAADTMELTPFDFSDQSHIHQVYKVQEAMETLHIGLHELVEQRLGIPAADIDVYLSQVSFTQTSNANSSLHIPIQSIAGVTPENEVVLNEPRFLLAYFSAMTQYAHVYHTKHSNLPEFLQESYVASMGTEAAISRFYVSQFLDLLENDFDLRKELNMFDEENNPIDIARAHFDHGNYINNLDALIMATFVLDTPEPMGLHEFREFVDENFDYVQKFGISEASINSRVQRVVDLLRSDGMLKDMSFIQEMAYALDPVSDVIADLDNELIEYDTTLFNGLDKILLSGYWSPFNFKQFVWRQAHDLYLKGGEEGEEMFFEGTSVLQ